MSARLLVNYASSGDNNPQVIPLTGKTNGRDLFLLFTIAATPTLPSPWTELASATPNDGYFTKLWRLSAANNTAGVTQISIPLNGGRSMAAILWEDDVDTSTTAYVSLGAQTITSDNPALFGSGLHTFTQRDVAFAIFSAPPADSSAANTFDLVSYDHSFTDFGDSGSPLTNDRHRVYMATGTNVALTSDGIVATGNGPKQAAQQGISGVFAYDQAAAVEPAAQLGGTIHVMKDGAWEVVNLAPDSSTVLGSCMWNSTTSQWTFGGSTITARPTWAGQLFWLGGGIDADPTPAGLNIAAEGDVWIPSEGV